MRFNAIVTTFALFVALCASPLHAAMQRDAKPAGLRATVKKLIGDLASDSRTVRLKAEQSLLKLGPRILPLLPAPELISDIAARETVRRIRVRLDHAEAARSVKASRVSLRGMMPVRDVLKAIEKQTGNQIDFQKLPVKLQQQIVKVAFDKTPFWETLEFLHRQAGVAFIVGDDGKRLIARSAKPGDAAMAVDGSSAFRVAVKSIRFKTLFGDDKHNLLNVQWSIAPEPRLRPLFLKYEGKAMTASADGKPLSPYSADAKLDIPVTGGAEPVVLPTLFRVPKSATLSTIDFRGEVRILVAAAQESIAFRNLAKAKGAAKRRGGVTVTIRELSIGAKSTTVGIAVAYDAGGPAFESHRTWMFHNRVQLKTPNGRKLTPKPGFKTTLQRDGAIGVQYEFDIDSANLAKAEFRYEAPTLLIKVPVKFEFKKLAVPK